MTSTLLNEVLRLFLNPLVTILLAASLVARFLDDPSDALITTVLVTVGAWLYPHVATENSLAV